MTETIKTFNTSFIAAVELFADSLQRGLEGEVPSK